jgi:general secretion pathway protein I
MKTRALSNRRGFSLLEVLVAVAILGLGLTVILSAQAGAFQSAETARNMSVATGLLRCKMAEVEEHLYKDGFQEADESGAGPCCDNEETPNMRCTWRVDRPQFPEARFGDLDLNAGLNLGSGSAPGAGGPGQLGALGLLSQAGAGSSPMGATSPGDVAKLLSDANAQAAAGAPPLPSPMGSGTAPSIPGGPSMDPTAGGAGSGMGGLASMAMSIVYPSLKQLFEASTRRIVATVTFRQGKKDYSIEVTEWFCIPQKGLTVDDLSAPDTTGPASSGTPAVTKPHTPSGHGKGTP